MRARLVLGHAAVAGDPAHPARTTREDSIVRKITVRALAALAAATLALGLAPGVAQAQPREVVIGPVTHCSVITFFDYVIFEYDCNYGA
jgi:hypothetical protein